MTATLPQGWCEAHLVDLVEILDSQRVPINSKERAQRLAKAKETYPYYGATGQVGEIDDYIFDGEAVLLGEDGVPFFDPYKHKAYLVSGRYWVNNHAHVLRGNRAIENEFLCHQLNVLDYHGHVSGTTRLKLTQASMKELPILLPPIEEQRRITEKIDVLFAELDKGEESLRQVQALLARYRQSVLKAAVTGELTAGWRAERAGELEHASDLLQKTLKVRPEAWQGRGRYKAPEEPDTGGLPRLPDSWVWATIDQLSLAVDYGTSAKCSDDATGVPVLRMGNIVDGGLDLERLKYLPEDHHEFPRLLLEENDLLFNRTNSAELVGKTAVYKGVPETSSFASYLIRVRLSGVSADFVSAFINSVYGRAWVRSVVSQQVGQANVNGTKLKALPVPLPPAEEQAEIISRMDEALSQVASGDKACRSELGRAAALRQSILKEAFSGRLVPQDPNDEPASELLARLRAMRGDRKNK